VSCAFVSFSANGRLPFLLHQSLMSAIAVRYSCAGVSFS
jgi:hypothetical protein